MTEHTELYKALASAQAEFDTVDRTTKGYNYKYAPLDVVRAAVLPTLHKHGLVVVQFPINDDERIGVETILAHNSGQSISRKFVTPLSKKDPQSVGSALTYYRRYSLLACLGLAPVDEDDDADTHSTRREAEENPGAYIMNFGKYKGLRLYQIDSSDLFSWSQWMVKNGKTQGAAKEVLAAVDNYLADIGFEP